MAEADKEHINYIRFQSIKFQLYENVNVGKCIPSTITLLISAEKKCSFKKLKMKSLS